MVCSLDGDTGFFDSIPGILQGDRFGLSIFTSAKITFFEPR